MEQLYPQNIIERRYPVIREQREKAEREAAVESESKKKDTKPDLEADSPLYEPIPYKEGNVGKHLNTLA
ncbi:hypothetical protein MLD52_01160 [Puniceicoccaceae bacterium K14]|nr:hypothetical protein [Puniceicoccaceae bacterium K14]